MRLFGLDINRATKREIATTEGIPWMVNVGEVGTSSQEIGRDTYLDAIYRAIADEFSKLDFFPVKDKDSEYERYSVNELGRLISLRPNELMTACGWQWIVAYQTMRYQNSLSKISRNSAGTVVSIDPIDVRAYDFGQGFSTDGGIFLKVRDKITQKIQLWDYRDLIHIRCTPIKLLDGDKPSGLDGAQGIVKLYDKSLQSMLKEYAEASDTIRGIVQVGNQSLGGLNKTLSGVDEKITKQKEISKRIRETGHEGILVLDAGEEWKDLTYKSIAAEQMKTITGYITALKGVSEKVIAGTANESEMEVFWSKTVMPLVEQFTEEATWKLFSGTNGNLLSKGIKIDYERNLFEYVSAATAFDQIYKAHMDLTVNEVRRLVLHLPPIEGGDVLLNNKNFESMLEDESKGGESNV